MNQKVKEILQDCIDPNTGASMAASLKHVICDSQNLCLELEFGYPVQTCHQHLREIIVRALQECFGNHQLDVQIRSRICSAAVKSGLKILPNIKNIIAVASGKGGVGKSTTAVNLALALQAQGTSVGILDADIYGPSQPMMMGLKGKPGINEKKQMHPMENYGVQTMSIGYLVEADNAMIWRGPMVSTALQQLLNETLWKELDYLIVDLPPGTGDIQLTLVQKIPVSGAIIVTTPQDIALLDAKKALNMFRKVDVPVLGIVENMSHYVCPNCQHHQPIFGADGGEQMATTYRVPLLGKLPLDLSIRQQTDQGKPSVVADPTSPISLAYQSIATQTAAQIARLPRDLNVPITKIEIEETNG